MSNQTDYLRTVAELQEIARGAPYVTQDWVLQVASMDPADMRRRLIRSSDWHGHFAHSLDGIPEILALPGSGIDGCRSHKEVRAVVLHLIGRVDSLRAEVEALRSETERLRGILPEVVEELNDSLCDENQKLRAEVEAQKRPLSDAQIKELAAAAGIEQQVRHSGGTYVLPTPVLRRFVEMVRAAIAKAEAASEKKETGNA